jgi:hypothetical protein
VTDQMYSCPEPWRGELRSWNALSEAFGSELWVFAVPSTRAALHNPRDNALGIRYWSVAQPTR